MNGLLRPFPATIMLAGAVVAAALFSVPVRAEDASRAAQCTAPASAMRLALPLTRTAQRLAAGQSVKIVAIGSSSTAGAGASSPDRSYPSRLAVELASALPKSRIEMLNRGVNGDTTQDMLARFERDVIAERPTLVLWQVGTNAVLRDHPLQPAATLLDRGLERLKTTGADVVLIDPQFAPKVLVKPDADDMVELIARAAKRDNVNLFQRFAVMRHWRQDAGIPFETFLSEDQLHLNDWSYACMARLLAGAIAEAATRSTQTAGIPAPR